MKGLADVGIVEALELKVEALVRWDEAWWERCGGEMMESNGRRGGRDTAHVGSGGASVEMWCSCYENDDFGE